MSGNYEISIDDIIENNIDDIVDNVCDGCHLVKLYHSGKNMYGEQIDPPEYICPLDFEPEIEYDIDIDVITFSCNKRNSDDF